MQILQLYDELLKITHKDNIFADEPMKNHTTFKIGGPADYYVAPNSESEFIEILKFANNNSVPVSVIGNGSNILVSDKGVRGIVLSTSLMNKISVNGEVIKAQSGASLSKITSVALKNALTGFEFASGIPGYIGGAVVMNAGAYGGEMKDVVVRTKYSDDKGNIGFLNGDEHNFSYRKSFFSSNEKLYVLETEIKLSKGNIDEISSYMKELSLRRCDKQPLNYPSAGSTFKRPEGYFAAKLIDDSGLRGRCVNDACVSEKHCGFIVNKGNASAKDVLELIETCRLEVKQKFGVDIEPEVKMIGDF